VEEAPIRRTVGSLRQARDTLFEKNQREQAERAARVDAERARATAAARARHLDSLKGREDELWRAVEAAIATKKPKEYAQAVDKIKDLRHLATHTGRPGDAVTRIHELRERHASKPSFIRRLNEAGLVM